MRVWFRLRNRVEVLQIPVPARVHQDPSQVPGLPKLSVAVSLPSFVSWRVLSDAWHKSNWVSARYVLSA